VIKAVVEIASIPVSTVHWSEAVRIIRSLYPPIDLFEDIADPADWPLLIAAEQKTNPRLMESIGNLDLVPPARRVSGPGSSYLMAPFTHASYDRPSRFSDGSFGVLYVADTFETALFETIHHHQRFMAATREAPGWTSQFREIVLDVAADLRDLREEGGDRAALCDPEDYAVAQAFGMMLRTSGAEGILYPSARKPGGECVALFYPDRASHAVQARHFDYHWDGARVDMVRDASNGKVYRVL
jgi:RES domain-containing protein